MTLAPWVQRLAAIGILAMLLLAAWGMAVGPLLDDIAQRRQEIAGSRALLARYAHLAREVPALEAELARLRRDPSGGSAFLEGTTPAMVAARLQSDVQRIAAAAHVALRSSETLPPQSKNGMSRIGLELELGVSPDGLRRLLHGVETARPALFVEKLSVRVPENGLAPPAADGQPTLTARFEIAGYAPAGKP